ncbi:MAG: hypothetical protein HUU31_14395 [Anaerolineae bacterium]|nr:hypothetical protein [Anaerolineae bacterium]
MDTVLALAWRVQASSLERFRRNYSLLSELYCGISIYTPPNCDPNLLQQLSSFPNVKLTEGRLQVENRRYFALRQALEFACASYMHYCDGDHAFARIEQNPQDWKVSLETLHHADCLIIERSPHVLESYPQALKTTERIINLVGTYLLGQSVDLGSGSRGFSRRAVEHLIVHASPNTHGVATDMEWPVLLSKAGFTISTYESDGAIYEIENEDHRHQLENANQWSKRVELARLIIDAGIRAANRSDLPLI